MRAVETGALAPGDPKKRFKQGAVSWDTVPILCREPNLTAPVRRLTNEPLNMPQHHATETFIFLSYGIVVLTLTCFPSSRASIAFAVFEARVPRIGIHAAQSFSKRAYYQRP
jgi:hypothetical protein